MKLKFAYRAGRNYIEVSQIVEKFFESLAQNGVTVGEIKDFEIRSYILLNENVEVVKLQNELDASNKNHASGRSPAGEISFSYLGQLQRYQLFQTEEKVTLSEPDPEFDGDKLISNDSKVVWLNDLTDYKKYFWCYVLMRLMREFGNRLNSAKKTIAVEIKVQFVPRQEQLKDLKIDTLIPRRMGFAVGKVLLGDETMGKIKIKL